MKAQRVIVSAALFLALFAGNAGTALAGLAGSPWPMFQGDQRHSGRSLFTGPRNPVLKWSFHVQGTPGSPVIGSDGTIYLPTGMLNEDTSGYLYAIAPGGTERWRYQFAGLPSSTAPAIASDGTIYVHMNGDEGNIAAVEKLYALNPDGSLRWVFRPNGDLASFASSVQSSPVIGPDGTIYVGSMNTSLCAVNPDGTLKWAVSPSASSISSSPALGPDGTIYFLDSGFELWAYDPHGTMKWSAALSDASGGDGSASVGADGTIYVATAGNATVHAVNPAGSVKWSKTLGFNPVATPAIAADGTIYVNDDGLYALHPDGSLKWKYGEDALFSTSSPLIGGDGTIYSRESWKVYAVNPTGTTAWTINVPSSGSSGLDPSPAIGSDGTLYMPQPDVFDSSNQYLKAYADRPSPPAPEITGLKPFAGRRGALVTIAGTGFGATRDAGAARFGATRCTKYVSWSDAQIRCRVPMKARFGTLKVTVTTTAGKSNARSFKVKR